MPPKTFDYSWNRNRANSNMRYGRFTRLLLTKLLFFFLFFFYNSKKNYTLLIVKLITFVPGSPGMNQHNILTYNAMFAGLFLPTNSEKHVKVFVPLFVPYPQSDMTKG